MPYKDLDVRKAYHQAYSRRWQESNREKTREATRRWRERNIERVREDDRRRQALRRQKDPGHGRAIARASRERRRHGGLRHKGPCLDCGRPATLLHHLDGKGVWHPSPNNTSENQVPLCHSCHAKRHALDRAEFIEIICAECGETFRVPPGRAISRRGRPRRFCSPPCWYAFKTHATAAPVSTV